MMDDCMTAVPEPPRARLSAQVVEHTVEVAEDKPEPQAVEDGLLAWARPDSRRPADIAVAEDSRLAWAPERAHTAVVLDRV